MSTAIIFDPVCDVINFKINPDFLVKLLLYIDNKLRQKCKYLKNTIFLKLNFKELSFVKNGLSPEGRPLRIYVRSEFLMKGKRKS